MSNVLFMGKGISVHSIKGCHVFEALQAYRAPLIIAQIDKIK